ncbi:fatty-acid-binding protein 2 [Telopea speciosissima]|uniref:fatty-acid-binding protein 2 n=1 Tax=Telopea speciosissima TaxID=54955 RepID=UPI001CC5C489|nr:fatty-acid-binding protein 2 [Telopea speciosissima]
MRNGWFFLMDVDGGSPYILPTEPLISQNFGGHLLSHIGSFVDSSLYLSRYLNVPGSLALQEAFGCISKFAGALLFLFSSGSNGHVKPLGSSHGSNLRNCKTCSQVKQVTSCRHNTIGLQFNFRSRGESSTPFLFGKIARSTIRHLCKEFEQLQSIPVLSLAAALVPPFDKNLSPRVLAIPLENTDVEINSHMNQQPCLDERRGCATFSFVDMNWTRHAVEPRTGIKFPTVLELDGENNSSFTSEVLVGTGSRTMRILKIKSLKVYAFGLYIQPDSICEKLGPKYASVPVSELNNQQDFFDDLLRNDIHMTVRLVVNCNGLKINTVRDAFEKSLRARLLKLNPNNDGHCLRSFRSYFTRDIPLPEGTTIDFRQTADGNLITEIGGEQIGAVHSKDLCRAFFDMYIGDVPVSAEAKEEIARNIGNIMRQC